MSLPLFAKDKLSRMKARKDKKKAKAKRLGRKPSPKALTKKLDALVGALVRSRGHCESGRDTHAGPLQWAHGFSRSYHAVRWVERNGFCLCAGCHKYFTHRPLEWDEWLRAKWGDTVYEVLRDRALRGIKPDKAELLRQLS